MFKSLIRGILVSVVAASCPIAGSANEQLEAARVEAQRRADLCKATPEQSVTVRFVPTLTKPASEPATPEKEERVKELLRATGLPYDRQKNRVTYEFTLSLVRTKNVMTFAIKPGADSGAAQALRQCLTRFGEGVGIDFRIEVAAQ